MKRINTQRRNYTTLLQDCFPDLILKNNIDHVELNDTFEAIFDDLKKNRSFSERKEKVLKLYYHIKPMDNGLYCSSYKELSEIIYNENNGITSITPTRARQLVNTARLFIIAGKSFILKEKFFIKENIVTL